MVDNINIPEGLTRLIEVKDTSDVLRRFLILLTNKIRLLEEQQIKLENRIKELEDGN